MGKSNRIRINRADTQIKTVGVRKEKKGMPTWAVNVIAVVITLAVLALAAIPFLSSNGIFGRMQTAMKSEHFSVNQNMMTYYFNASYQNFCSQYSSYISNGNFSLNPSKDLKAQTFADPNAGSALETYILGSFEGTWFDYFMNQTTSEVETMLLYCEEAYARGWELGEEENAAIDKAVASLTSTATSNQYTSLDLFLSQNFGNGVQEQDVRDALKLSELATLCSTRIGEEVLSGISAEQVNAAYDATGGVDIDGNGTNINKIDYSYYTFTVKYSEMEGATDADKLQAYLDAIAKAKANAEALEKITDAKEFEKFILPFVVEDNYDAEYKTATTSKDAPKEGTPSADDLKTIREAMIKKIIEEIENEVKTPSSAFEKTEDKYTVYGVEVSKEWADLFEKVKTEVLSTAKLALPNFTKDRAEYVDSDAFSTWAFDAARKAGEVYKNLKGDASDASADTSSITSTNATQFTASVYLLRSPAGKDTTPTRNLSYMIFTSKDKAKAAIDALAAKDAVNAEVFEEIAHSLSPDAHDELENYMKGDMGIDSFDAWAYDKNTTEGSFTTTPVELDSATYAVLFYASEGEQTWFMQVKEVLYNQAYEAKYETVKAAYTVEKKENVIKAVSAVKLNLSSSSGMSLV